MGKVFKSNTWLLILDPEVQLWNEKLKCLRENEKKQTISIAAGNYDTAIITDLINQAIQDFRVKYQKSCIGFENLVYLQSIENECNIGIRRIANFMKVDLYNCQSRFL